MLRQHPANECGVVGENLCAGCFLVERRRRGTRGRRRIRGRRSALAATGQKETANCEQGEPAGVSHTPSQWLSLGPTYGWLGGGAIELRTARIADRCHVTQKISFTHLTVVASLQVILLRRR